jgi:mannan endo-1,4-beta-mannosidase
VDEVFSTARGLGLSVLRTWAFYDSPDSSDSAVFQLRPGEYNEVGLRGLDCVIASAKAAGIRLILPLVNSWDDYGGMNQYVRWRAAWLGSKPGAAKRYSGDEMTSVVNNGEGERYRVALSSSAGHDDFFTDTIIRSWYKQYVAMLFQRVNTVTGVAYRDEPAILGWELANEPRSSDASGKIVTAWLEEMSAFVKSLDVNHLVGSGEEGFDVTPDPYSVTASSAPCWLFDGTGGVSFARNTAIANLDFASIHLYSDNWNIPASAGSPWIQEHAHLAGALARPIILGEFGVKAGKSQVFESWLTTVLLDGVTGALAWQLLDNVQQDVEGFGFRCPGDLACPVLQKFASLFAQKAAEGTLPVPAVLRLHPNYPDPFTALTTVTYDLPWDARVELEVFDFNGAAVLTTIRGAQGAGARKELLDGQMLASGTYLYHLRATSLETGECAIAKGKLTVLH